MKQIFSTVTVADSYKADGENNPLFTQRFGADPGVMEYNGRVYVYMTNDVVEYDSEGNIAENTYNQINQINCISSDDLVNWIDYGAITVAGSNGAATWATRSWAPCIGHNFQSDADIENWLLLLNSYRDSEKDPLLFMRRCKATEAWGKRSCASPFTRKGARYAKGKIGCNFIHGE